ncbi:MAG: bifunctional nuclease family protein [Propioniciclava sp.]
MIELVLGEVRMTDVAREPVLVLREAEGERVLPVWLSAAAAHAVLAGTDIEETAPGAHDLILEILGVLDRTLDSVRIVGFAAGVYRCEAVIGSAVVSTRLSDGVALALRRGVPILIDAELMDAVAVVERPPEGGNRGTADAQVEKFRAFLDSINPDDFDATGQ